MLKRKAAVVVGAFLLGAGAVQAAESVFPTGSNEVSSSEWYKGGNDMAREHEAVVGARTDSSPFPSSVSEVSSPDRYEATVAPRDIGNRMTRYNGPAFPVSPGEVGSVQ
jgi:hypothetical protein